MPRLVCPIAGYEKFEIEFPDEWLVGDYEKFVQGQLAAREAGLFGDQSPVNTARFYGCKAACSVFKGGPDKPVEQWPLAVYLWFLEAVYYGAAGLDKAINPPKN